MLGFDFYAPKVEDVSEVTVRKLFGGFIAIALSACADPALRIPPGSDIESTRKAIITNAQSSYAVTSERMEVIEGLCQSTVAGIQLPSSRLRLIGACGIREGDSVFPCESDVVVVLDPSRGFGSKGIAVPSTGFLMPFDFDGECEADFALFDVFKDTGAVSVEDAKELILPLPLDVSPLSVEEMWRPEVSND